ncbi:hypothetical protein BDB00DRAFT_541943 [Zychaea mexicana]|uniref:uncharacterized protein n=1 Tax=Zychaea mexicana TaxID=64656 RepID=UPI0022FEBAB4|nr:uncharacterized protein BDB00DRAFT_541943 [Zychaea mexicana]KAI9497826.1 hypothetical protein BDB00DRAFT_541943 [Zychaea mexicana]
MVTNVHRRLSALSLKYAFDEQRSFLSRGFQKIFVQQPPKCISNDNTTSTSTSSSSSSSSNNDDISSYSSEDDQFSPSASLTPSTSSYSVPSFSDDCCDISTVATTASTTDAILCMGVVFVWLHIQLQLAILLQRPSAVTTPLPLTTTTTVTKSQLFNPKPLLPSRSPGPDMPPVADLVRSQVSLETAALWTQHEHLPQCPSSSRRRRQLCSNNHYASTIDNDDNDDNHQAAAVRSLAQDVLAYLEEFSGDVAPELEALKPQLETYVAL